MSKTNPINTNVHDYSINELIQILKIANPITPDKIISVSNIYIDKFTKENNTEMADFFENIQKKLLEPKLSNYEEYDQDPNEVTNTFSVPVTRDTINPVLKNVTTRVININSQFREDTYEAIQSSSTNYSYEITVNEYSATYFNANLSDSLINVLSLTLENCIIPKTWYMIDNEYGNNYFWITNNNIDFLIIIPSGNYTPSTFVTQFNQTLVLNQFIPASEEIGFITYSDSTGKVSLYFDGAIDPSGAVMDGVSPDQNINFTSPSDIINALLENNPYLTFFDFGNIKLSKYNETHLNNTLNPCILSATIDTTLGWLMGYRHPFELIHITGNNANTPLNLNSSTSFSIILEDFKTNRVSNDIVTIINKKNEFLSLPSYIYPDLLHTCNKIDNYTQYNNISQTTTNESNIDNYLLHQYQTSTSYVQYIPSAPRMLTQAQMYSANEIIKNNNKKTVPFRSFAPTFSDLFALIPLDASTIQTGNLFLHEKLQANKRVYFGPVDIDRFTIKLLNDKGQLVNLNGADWSFTITAEILYQY